MSHVVVATGFNREVATLRQSGIVVVAGGGDPVGLRARLEQAAAGAAGIVSYGMTGALVDGLQIGDWIVGDRLSGAIDLECDTAWAAALLAMLPGARSGGFYADGRMIDTVAEKLALGERHGAIAVDMESHVAGAVAAERGLPFAIVRCVSGRGAASAAACDHRVDAIRWRGGYAGDAAVAGAAAGASGGCGADDGGLRQSDAGVETRCGSDRSADGCTPGLRPGCRLRAAVRKVTKSHDTTRESSSVPWRGM